MILYAVFLILNSALLFGLIKKKKKIFAAMGICTEAALICLIILGLTGISLTPGAFLIINIAAALWCLTEMYVLFFKGGKITVTVAAVLAVLLIVAIVPFYPACYVYFVLNAALIFVSIKNKKKKLAVIGICMEIALLCLIVFRVISIPSVYYTVNIAAALWCLIEMYVLFFKGGKITVIVASALCVLFIAATVFYYPAYLKRTVDGTDYMAVYSKWTGVSETKVSYHHMYNSLFMTSDASFTENYGILFCGWKDVFNYEPYSASNDEGVIDPQKLENLEDMLSKLNTNTTMQDVIAIFGKAPRMKPETNSDIWEYYCGGTTVTLTGINNQNGTLFRVVVDDGVSSHEPELTDSDK